MLNPTRTLPAMIAIGLFVVLLAAALVWWSSVWTSDVAAARGLSQCLREVGRRDAVATARVDLARGEDRPFFANAGPAAARAPDIEGCKGGGFYTDSRPWPFDTQSASDDCARAARDWVASYNAELARLEPRVGAKYCRGSWLR